MFSTLCIVGKLHWLTVQPYLSMIDSKDPVRYVINYGVLEIILLSNFGFFP